MSIVFPSIMPKENCDLKHFQIPQRQPCGKRNAMLYMGSQHCDLEMHSLRILKFRRLLQDTAMLSNLIHLFNN